MLDAYKELYKEHSLGLYDVRNSRDLGGYKTADGHTIKKGLLLRSSQLGNAGQEDLYLLTSTYHLKAIVDFRLNRERSLSPDPKLEGVDYFALPLVDDESPLAGGRPRRSNTNQDPLAFFLKFIRKGELHDDMYIRLFNSERFQRGMSSFFRILLNNDGEHAIIWHCAAGKDRAGSASVLVLLALGVDKETALVDFNLSNIAYEDFIRKRVSQISQYTKDPEILTAVRSTAGVNRDYMENAINDAIEHYGSIENYLQECMKVSSEDIEKLKQIYLM